MNTLELKARLQQPYNRNNWIEVAKDVFHNLSILEKPLAITGKPDFVKSFQQLGFVNLQDGRNLAMIEIIVDDTKNLVRNKVQLRNLTNKLIDEHSTNGVLVIYDNQLDNNYRFTFASKQSVINEKTGEFEKIETNAKRFTYLLGPGESCTTAASQLTEIANKGGGAEMEDIVKAFNVEKINKEFFNGYKKQYEAFTAHLSTTSIKTSVFNGVEKEIRDFAKKMMGRIVFIYFLQKKGWMGVPQSESSWKNGDKDFLRRLFVESGEAEDYYAVWLSKIFFDTLNNKRENDSFTMPSGTKVKVPYLNGGLFEAENSNTALLTFPPALFINLFEFLSQYNFTIYEDDPEERFLAVDPEMLGHIFENLLEDNKDKGAFYTPKEIVHYMCRESLIEYLYTKLNPTSVESYSEIGKSQTDLFGNKAKKQLSLEHSIGTVNELIKRESIEKLVLRHEAAEIINYEKEILKALYEVRICDPAIGSGAFPMGLLTEIFQLVETLHQVTPDVTSEVWGLGNYWNAAKVKKQIIQNSIYGVDIEKGAVDIARLRFWLSLVIEEEEPNPLPNLDYKIVVGNSLLSKFEDEVIDIDWDIKFKNASAVSGIITDQQAKFHLLHTKLLLYFVAKGDKTKLKKEIRNLKVSVLINQITLSRIQYTEGNRIQKSAFPTKEEIQKAEEITDKTRDYNRVINKLEGIKVHRDRPFEFFDWKLDFPEVMNEKIAKNIIGFDIVIANPPYVLLQENKDEKAFIPFYKCKYSTASYKIDLYHLFIEKGILLIKTLGNLVYINPSNFLTNNFSNSLRKYILENTSFRKLVNITDNVFDASVNTCIIQLAKPNYLNNKIEFVQADILNSEITFKAFSNQNQKEFISSEYLIVPVENSNFSNILKLIEKETTLLGSKFKVNFGMQLRDRKKYINDVLENPLDSQLTEYHKKCLTGRDLSRYKTNFNNRYCYFNEEAKRGGCWDELVHFQKNKIVIRQIGHFPICSIDPWGYPILNSAFMVTLKDGVFDFDTENLLGILNSKLIQFYWKNKFSDRRKTFPKIKGTYLMQLPIPSTFRNLEIFKIVKKIISIKNNSLQNNTEDLEKEIDLIVYHLYKLTFEESSIIEGNTEWMSKIEYDKSKIE